MVHTNKSPEELFEEFLANKDRKNLVLHNDDFNTFPHVMYCLIKVCDHSPFQAEQCAMLVHHKGKCQVKSGSEDQMNELRKVLIENDLTATVE